MCGINGAIVFEGHRFTVTQAYLTRMRDTMTHRGPDGAGVWASPDGRVGLGHRRLSIIDLSDQASQPMCNEDGSLWVTFNGEIYNHAQLRTQLNQAGDHQWKTDHCDTEVILHGFEQWGIGCVDRLEGMFAFALWDARTQQLWLVRDRIGVKPLYYSHHNGRLVFASEIKALLQDPDQQRRVDERSLYHFLSFLTTPPPHTLFEGIDKLPGGTWLRASADGQITQHRYWDVWDHTQPLTGIDEQEINQRVLHTLRHAVQQRKVSDVPVGVFLSGGIDSSTNAALFSEGHSDPIQAFTIGYQGQYRSYRNELDHARTMARQVHATHHEKLLTLDDLIDFLPQMVELQDEPIADPVCVPLYYVAKLARDHGVKVCQLGEGADELFWGYLGWKRSLQAQRLGGLPAPRWIKRMGMGALQAIGRQDGMVYEWLRRSVMGRPVFWGGAELFHPIQKQRLISPAMRARFGLDTTWQHVIAPIQQRFLGRAWEPSGLHWMTYLDLNIRLPELLLMRVDKMAMGVGLEGRVPFLDHRLVTLALSIPESVKTRGGRLKHTLKESVRGLIPDPLIDRPKQGFAVPIHEWLLGRLGDQAQQAIRGLTDHTGFFDRASIEYLLKRGHSQQVWTLFNLAMWWRCYIG